MSMFTKATLHRRVPLRPYQDEFVTEVEKSWEGHGKVLAVLGTGAGKTMCAGELAARAVERGQSILVLAHTRKLVKQFAGSLRDDYGLYADIEMANLKAHHDAPIVVGSVQSISGRIGKNLFGGRKFDYVYIDEAHRALSKSYEVISRHYPDAKYLGLTATPRRGDQKDLLQFFDVKSVDVPMSRLIKEGWLSPLIIKNVGINIRIEAQSKTGDYTEAEVGHALEPYLDALADAYVEHGKGRCGLIFLPLIEISKKFAQKLLIRGVAAGHVDGEMREKDISNEIACLENGNRDCICNSMLLTEGVDIRPVNLIMNLRPTRSWTLYVQMCGRGTRLFDEGHIDDIEERDGQCKWKPKSDCILLDPLWLCEMHNLLQRPATLIAQSTEEAEEIDKKLKGGGDLMEAVESAARDRHATLIERLKAAQRKKDRQIDAMEFFANIGDFEGAEYEPMARWEFGSLTIPQKNTFLLNDINPDSIAGPEHAQRVLRQIFQRQKDGKATIKMARYAESLGLKSSWQMSFGEVKRFLDAHSAGKNNLDLIPT